jgi:predicted porin
MIKPAWPAALAIALSCGANAYAQSARSLYGRIDLNLTRVSGQGWDMNQRSTSRLGVRGSEDLGGGLLAIFQLESAIDADVGGASASRFWGRESWVGLRGRWGTLRLGRSQTPSQRLAANHDPHSTDGIGSLGSAGLLIGLAALPRFQDGLYYETPEWSGFTLYGGAQLDDIANNAKNRHRSVRVRYVGGPFDMSVATAEMGNRDKVRSIGLAYKIGAVSPMMQYHLGERTGVRRSTVLIGAQAALGVGAVRAAWSQSDDKRHFGAGVTDRTLTAIGYDHPMSKRTLLYGTVASETSTTMASTSERLRKIELGIRHIF